MRKPGAIPPEPARRRPPTAPRPRPAPKPRHRRGHRRGRFKRWLRLAPLALTLVTFAWVMLSNPFAAPMVERSAEQMRRTLDRAMARQVDLEWLLPRLALALAKGDRLAVESYAQLAQEYSVELPPSMAARVAQTTAPPGLVSRAQSCAVCALEIGKCRNLSLLGVCAIPFELSPLGDLNALRRGAQEWAAGRDIDRLETGLALTGLAASGAIIASGGASGPVKLGAGLVRMARRMGTLTPQFTRVLRDTARLPVKWDQIPAYSTGRVALGGVTDTAQLARLKSLTGDLGTIRRGAGTAEALVLMRHVETAEDAARMAKTATALGPRAPRAFTVLGKTRVFRALIRLSDLARAAIALAFATVLQLLMLGAQNLGGSLFRRVLRD